MKLLPSRLEQFDWVAGRILEEDLLPAVADDELVAKPGAGRA